MTMGPELSPKGASANQPTGRFLAAAIAILRRRGAPMTAAEITDAAITAGLLTTRGKTPVTTMSARLYVEALRSKSPLVVKMPRRGTKARPGSVRWALADQSTHDGAVDE
jgi:hypothetical protein